MQAFSVSRQTISNWVDQGMPKIKENQFDLVACFQWRLHDYEARWETSKEKLDLAKEEARYRRIQGDLKELELAEKRGDLIPLVLVRAEWDRLVSAAKTQLLAIPTRLAAKLPAPAETKVKLKEIAELEVTQTLNELSSSDGIPNSRREPGPGSPGSQTTLGKADHPSAKDDGKPVGRRKKIHPSRRKPRVSRKVVDVPG
ncbi:MAG: hypothetical protein AB1428_13040 [Bacteroidota bacterium]